MQSWVQRGNNICIRSGDENHQEADRAVISENGIMKILIVDDNLDDRKVLRYMVEKNRHEAIEAEDGFDGLKKAKQKAPDLIISDALMPVMDGFQFLKEVKQEPSLRSVPFIFYSSSYKEYQDVRLAMSLGAAAYVIKPVDPVELWGKIETLLGADRKEKVPSVPLIKEDAEYLKRYSEVVATMLDEKVRELEKTLEERKRAEESLKKSEAFIKNILETVDVGFIILDREYCIESANKAFCSLVALPTEQVVGRKCYDVAHHQDRPCFETGWSCPVRLAFETGVSHTVSHMQVDEKGAKQYVDLKSYPIFDGSGAVVSVIETVNDVTEKKKLEEQLHQAQKMEAIGTLAGGVAHDFNNILTAIIGYGSLVKLKMDPVDPLQSSIDMILSSSERAAHLTQGLLAFSRKQIINPKPVDLNDIIKNVEKLLRRLISEDIEISTRLSSKNMIVMADVGQIEQVLMNLVTNARDAMPEGGELTITTEEIDLCEDFVAAHGYDKRGKHALITVSDTGIGMDEETREKIFEPFFTTKEIGKGTGLGLSIVYGIVKQHDGNINVYSEPGHGTIFKIYLPLFATHIEVKSAEALSPPRRGTETILLAEDDLEVRNLTKLILADFGYRVIDAVDGQDALDKFRQHAQEIDLLVLDVIMPKKSGKEIYDAIRSTHPDIDVLFISGYTADILHKKGIFDKGFHFVSKPISPFEFLRKIREILDKNSNRMIDSTASS
jgi:PAS domain S-box-containing protein